MTGKKPSLIDADWSGIERRLVCQHPELLREPYTPLPATPRPGERPGPRAAYDRMQAARRRGADPNPSLTTPTSVPLPVEPEDLEDPS